MRPSDVQEDIGRSGIEERTCAPIGAVWPRTWNDGNQSMSRPQRAGALSWFGRGRRLPHEAEPASEAG